MALEIPDGGITKSRKGRGGTVSWPNFVWEEILGQLVIGVLPKAAYRSIARIVRRVAPKKQFKQPISLTTIRRARTVLLVIVQTLASYRLGKANKWGQLFHDATQRRQISFQNLVISIEEHELFK